MFIHIVINFWMRVAIVPGISFSTFYFGAIFITVNKSNDIIRAFNFGRFLVIPLFHFYKKRMLFRFVTRSIYCPHPHFCGAFAEAIMFIHIVINFWMRVAIVPSFSVPTFYFDAFLIAINVSDDIIRGFHPRSFVVVTTGIWISSRYRWVGCRA